MKRSFFQAAVTSILLYGCTTWTLTKRLEKKLDGNYTRMLRAILNKSWQQHPTRHQLYGHLPPITKTIQVRRTRHEKEYMCYNQTGDISTLEGTPLKLVEKFTYLGSSVESTEKDIETRLTKAWTAINRLSIIWKSDLTDKMKRSFFQDAVTSILLYGCTTWTLTKRLDKKLDGNYTRMLRAILNKSWQQHPTRHQLYGHLPPITKTIQVRRTRHEKEYMCYNQTGDISTLEGTPLKLVDKFTYLGSSVESTEKDIETRLTKAWTAINRLSTIWKSDLTDKMKRSFFQAAVTSILLYGYTTWTLTKRLEKKLDGNYTRMLRAILNKSWQQHPTRHQLYGYLPPITKTIQVRRTRHAGHCWRSRDELIRDVLLWIPTHGRAKAGRPARTYIQQLCEDTGCCPEDLPRAMNDREEWRERVRDIRAASTIWWWW